MGDLVVASGVLEAEKFVGGGASGDFGGSESSLLEATDEICLLDESSGNSLLLLLPKSQDMVISAATYPPLSTWICDADTRLWWYPRRLLDHDDAETNDLCDLRCCYMDYTHHFADRT